MKTIMLLDGENRACLAMCRQFGRKGFRVIVGGRKCARTFYSRYCSNRFVYGNSEKSIIKSVKRNADIFKPEVIFPISSAATYALIKHSDSLNSKTIELLDLDRFNEFSDKHEMYKRLKGLAEQPKTVQLSDISDIKKLDIRFPVLLKPRVSSGSIGISYCKDIGELEQAYVNLSKKRKGLMFDPTKPMAQEFVKGEMYNVYVLFRKGKHIASMTNRFLETYPKKVGSQVSSITVSSNIQDKAIRLFTALNWNGPANSLFIVEDETPYLIEINPRIWATIESAEKAGIDFPTIMYEIAEGSYRHKKHTYRLGNKFSWILSGAPLRYALHNNEISLNDPLPNLAHLFNKIAYGHTL